MASLRVCRTFASSRTILLLATTLALATFSNGCKKSPEPEPSSSSAAVSDLPTKHAAVPFTKKHIYDETSDPKKEVATALKQAKSEHKRVLIDFGGDWCGDCQVLDIYFHQSPNEDLLETNFVVAHVFVNSHIDDPAVIKFAQGYGVPLGKGVPALAVLDANGKVLYAQKTGEFENMRHMDANSVTDFLTRWKS